MLNKVQKKIQENPKIPCLNKKDNKKWRNFKKYVKAVGDSYKEKTEIEEGKKNKKKKERQGSLKIQTKNCGPRGIYRSGPDSFSKYTCNI